MKALPVLLVLIPILLIVAILADNLGFTLGANVCGVAFLLAILAAFIWATCLALRDFKKRSGTPDGWSEAQALYPSRETIEGPRIRGFVKESGRGRFFLCHLRFDKNGVLVEDAQPPFSRGKLFVTWDVLEGPREIDLPWYIGYASLWWEAAVELAIPGTKLSLVVRMDVWTRHAAPHATGDADG